MFNQTRQDQQAATAVDRAVELYASGKQSDAITLLSTLKLADSVIARVLCDPTRRRTLCSVGLRA